MTTLSIDWKPEITDTSTHTSRGVYKSSKYLLRSVLCSSLLRPYERIQKILESGHSLHRVNIQLEFSFTPQLQNNGSKFLSGMLWARGVPCASCVLLGRCWPSSLKEKRSCSLLDVWLLSPLKLYHQRKDNPFQVLLWTSYYSTWSKLMQSHRAWHLPSVTLGLKWTVCTILNLSSSCHRCHTKSNTCSQDTSFHLPTPVTWQGLHLHYPWTDCEAKDTFPSFTLI